MKEYRTPLKSGGTLIIYTNSWEIQYYFPGPDRRYKGSFITINGKYIDNYINAWENNFNKFEELKKQHKFKNGQINLDGEAGMNIVVGGILEGVYLSNYRMCIKHYAGIQQIVNDYRKAKQIAEKIQKLFNTNYSNSTEEIREMQNIEKSITQYKDYRMSLFDILLHITKVLTTICLIIAGIFTVFGLATLLVAGSILILYIM